MTRKILPYDKNVILLKEAASNKPNKKVFN